MNSLRGVCQAWKEGKKGPFTIHRRKSEVRKRKEIDVRCLLVFVQRGETKGESESDCVDLALGGLKRCNGSEELDRNSREERE